jgi:hypothetical protein
MPIGDYKHLVVFQDPGPALPDGAGGYTQTWADLAPGTWRVSVRPAGVGDLERVGSGTVITQGASIVAGHYHAGVSTRSRMLYNGKTWSVTGARFVDTIPPSMELAVVEQMRPI